jgi:transcriptional regulator with XRE-family HTH domain
VNITRHVGCAVRTHRVRLKISQEELADKAGLDRTYVSGVERGVRNPTLKVLYRLATALQIDLAALFVTTRELASSGKTRRR